MKSWKAWLIVAASVSIVFLVLVATSHCTVGCADPGGCINQGCQTAFGLSFPQWVAGAGSAIAGLAILAVPFAMGAVFQGFMKRRRQRGNSAERD